MVNALPPLPLLLRRLVGWSAVVYVSWIQVWIEYRGGKMGKGRFVGKAEVGNYSPNYHQRNPLKNLPEDFGLL